MKKGKAKGKSEGLEIELEDFHKPFNENNSNIYGSSNQNPFSQVTPLGSVRSLASPKNFMPDKI